MAESTKKPWNFYYWPTKADSIHEPWAGGNGRVDTMSLNGDDEWIATPGGYIAPGVDIVWAGPNGLLETLPAAGDDATWFPNLYDDLTGSAPTRSTAARSRCSRPRRPCSSTTSFSVLRRGSGKRPSVRTRTSRAGPAIAWEARSPRSC